MDLKIPYGVSDFKNVIEEGYLYIDKTQYIKNLEREKVILYVRPRRFGKSLFTSMLDYYYSINEKDNFDKLFNRIIYL